MGISLLTAPSHAERSSSSKTSFRMHPSPPSDSGKKQISSGEQMVRAARDRECSEPAETPCPRSQPQDLRTRAAAKIYRGSADRPGSASPRLCLSENIQNGNLTPLLKIAEFTPNQLEVPLLKCVTTVRKYLVLSPKGSMSSQGGGNAQASSSGPQYWVLRKNRHREGASAERPPPSSGGARRPRAAPCRQRARSSGSDLCLPGLHPAHPGSDPLPARRPARAAPRLPPGGRRSVPEALSPLDGLLSPVLGRSSGLEYFALGSSALNPWPSLRGPPLCQKR